MNISNDGKISIDGEMTIYTASEIKNQLMQFNWSGETEINLSGVTEIDTAGLQLLMLMKREARVRNKPFRLASHSQAVIEVIEVCNLAEYFRDPMAGKPQLAVLA